MQICQPNRPLDKFMRFLFMHSSIQCIVTYGDKIFCDRCLTSIICINKSCAEICCFTVFSNKNFPDQCKVIHVHFRSVLPGKDWYDDIDHKEHIATSDTLLSSTIQLIQERLETETKQVLVKEGVRVRQRKCSHTLTNQNKWRATTKNVNSMQCNV